MVCTGVMEIEIMPPHWHISLVVLLRSGFPQTWTVGTPTTHVPGIAGVQGAGVNTPRAAEVAEMTAGLLGQEHMPKVAGLLSMMVATFKFMAFTVC